MKMFKRFTQRIGKKCKIVDMEMKDGIRYRMAIRKNEGVVINAADFQNAMFRLAEYEDLELSPEQIKEFDDLYADLCNQLNVLREENARLRGERKVKLKIPNFPRVLVPNYNEVN